MDAVGPSPRDYVAWCEERWLNPHHPEYWPDAEWETYVAALHAIVRPDVEPALDDWRAWRDRPYWPPARRSPWKLCPCHPHQFESRRGAPDGPGDVPDEETAAWVAEDPAGRAFVAPQVQKALAFIERFNPAKRKAVVA